MATQVTVAQVSASKTAGQFITKLVSNEQSFVNSDGLPIVGQKRTYYIMLSAEFPVGKELTINLDNYTKKETEYLIDGHEKPIYLTWLNPIK